MILIVCSNMPQFHLWCSEQHPQENPNDRKFVVFTASNWNTKRGGRMKQEGDRLIMLERIPFESFPSLRDIAMILVPCGFDEIEYGDETLHLRAFL